MDVADMREFQGNLKSLSETDYQKLKGEIVELGFSFPVAIWQNSQQNFILDGHQRRRVLLKMRDEGWQIPPIPVTIIFADSFKKAKQKLLGAASQFGKVEGQGLYEFLSEADIGVEEMMERVRLPELDLEMFKAEYFDDFSMGQGAQDPGKIGAYDGEKDTFSVRVSDVKASHKEQVLSAMNEALQSLAEKSPEMHYRAEAF